MKFQDQTQAFGLHEYTHSTYSDNILAEGGGVVLGIPRPGSVYFLGRGVPYARSCSAAFCDHIHD